MNKKLNYLWFVFFKFNSKIIFILVQEQPKIGVLKNCKKKYYGKLPEIALILFSQKIIKLH